MPQRFAIMDLEQVSTDYYNVTVFSPETPLRRVERIAAIMAAKRGHIIAVLDYTDPNCAPLVSIARPEGR